MFAIDDPVICYQLAGYERLQTPIWIYDIQNLKMRWANRAALLLWNAASLEELLSRDFSQVSTATHTRLQTYLELFEQGKTVVEQWTFYPKENTLSVRCTCSGIHLENGRLAMLVEAEKIEIRQTKDPITGSNMLLVNENDITSLKQTEEKLRWKETLLRSMTNTSPLGFYVVDNCTDEILYFNHKLCQIWGIEHLESQMDRGQIKNLDVIAECVKQLVDVAGFTKVCKPLQNQENRAIVEDEIPFKDGRIIRRFSAQIRDPDDRYFGRLYIFEDITERKRIEEQLQLADFSLEHSSLATVWIDRNAKIIRANKKACEQQGVSREELLSKYVWDNDPNFPKAAWTEHWEELKRQKTLSFTSEHRRKDGTIIPVEITLNYLEFNGKEYNFSCCRDISEQQAALCERKKAEATLQRREQEFRALVENAPDIIMRIDREFRYLYINPTVEKHLGIPAREFIGKNMAEFGADESLVQLWQTTIQQVFETAQEQEIEFQSPSIQGILYYATRIVPEFASDGSVQSVLAIARNITDRVEAEKALRQNEERMQALLKAIPDTMFRHRVDGTYLDIQANENTLLVPAEVLIGKKLTDLNMPEHISKGLLENFQAAVTTGKLQTFEHDLKKPDGMYTYEARIIKSGADEVVCIVRDITERKLVQKALQESEERYRSVVTAMAEGIVLQDANGVIHTCNSSAERILGLNCEQMMGKTSVDPLWQAIKEDGSPFPGEEHPAMVTLRTGEPCVNVVMGVHKPDGSLTWISINSQPLYKSGDSLPYAVVTSFFDITERKHGEEALQKALAAAQAASISKSRFLSQMSHELRTPLNAILGFSQVMARSKSLSAEQQEQLKIINRSGEHLLNLIDDILSMSKIEAGQITLNENRFDLYQLLNDIEQMLRFKAAGKGLQLIFERSANLPQYIESDESKLRQILINLLGNAVKFTNEGTIYLRAKLGNSQQAQSLINFEVEDTGAGIAPEEIPTMFDPFVQTETGRKSMQGTGLGLPISRQFVRLMGGDIAVKSQLGRGTIFTFDIKVKQVDRIQVKSTLTLKRVIGLQPNQPTYRILIVEDIEENRLLLVKLLKPLGFEIQEAVNGQEAIALWSTWQPHLIWMDMLMPIMDGYEATKQIKALQQQRLTNENVPKTVIIALTASAFEEEKASIFSSGCDDLVRKPFQESELFEKMAQHLGVRYIYADETQQTSLPSAIPKKLHAEDLKVMPIDWIAELNQAALCINDDIILELVKQIPETEAALADTLTDLVKNFRLDLILELTEAIIPSDS
ncbi:PAS domain S-box protein [Phormidium sp. LEGE 05292]|uniref:PAS domain S-box protein n=1 Tax=[Phormidium] sp. LEGE 05292 TaxID=767427 RepID=UPI00187EC330|nr:PAS domain S-box protein [Phormidium sp. LEGE 05292]MBE9225491.1 PAS domain S-box protein [Phormidium sp. LEGE 05292]